MKRAVVTRDGELAIVDRYKYEDGETELYAPYVKWNDECERLAKTMFVNLKLRTGGLVPLMHYVLKLEARLDDIESRLCK